MGALDTMVKRVVKNIDLRKKLNEMHNKKVAVGYFENATYTKDGKSTPVAYVASTMEFGSMHIPARPTIRPSLEKNKAKYFDLINKAVVNSLNGSDFKVGLMIVGKMGAEDIQAEIRNLQNPPLSIKTILKKGHSKPLMDTKVMFQSVTFKVD